MWKMRNYATTEPGKVTDYGKYKHKFEDNIKMDLRMWVRYFGLDLSDSLESIVGFQKRR
jgi:hypothetical protein